MNVDGLRRRKWTRRVSQKLGEGRAPSAVLGGDWGIVGYDARVVHDGQVGLACQVRLGLIERERVGERSVARCPDHFHGLADNYIATILLHATSFADDEPLDQSGTVHSTFARFKSGRLKCDHAISPIGVLFRL